jgi:hypothetical protein
MRGDFFCMPFGENKTSYKNEHYEVHGETANREWKLESISPTRIHLSLQNSQRTGTVDKTILLVPGHTAVYSQHVISAMDGSMPLGHHPILKVEPGVTGRVSLSAFQFGQVFPGPLECAANGGYSRLKPGARFSTLEHVPQIDGEWADISVYPAREGYEDLVLMASEVSLPFAWTALTIPEAGYIWFSLKDPRILPSTILWMSNGGRHYPPWNGRHKRVIGMEEVAANFHYGLAESVRENPLNRAGIPTCVRFRPKQPMTVNFIMAVVGIPRDFDIVESIKAAADGKSVQISSASGKEVTTQLNLSFLSKKAIFS